VLHCSFLSHHLQSTACVLFDAQWAASSAAPVCLQPLQAWFDYGCFCIRSGAHAKAHTALGEALALQQDHAGELLAAYIHPHMRLSHP
jgi:hypothetical protein